MEEELKSTLVAIRAIDKEEGLEIGKVLNALSMLSLALGKGSWVGVYLLKNGKWLLGPFEGTPACEKIRLGKGVVGKCGESKKTIAVEDVSKFPGYICCDASAKSEICVPLFQQGEIKGVFDVDLPNIHSFNKEEESLFELLGQELIRLGVLDY